VRSDGVGVLRGRDVMIQWNRDRIEARAARVAEVHSDIAVLRGRHFARRPN